MKTLNYSIRNYTTKDYHNFASFLEKLNKISGEEHFEPEDVFARINQPGYNPEEQLFIAVCEEEILGYLDMVEELDIERAIFYLTVHPDFRRHGIASYLMEEGKSRAESISAKVIHINLPGKNLFAEEILSGWGFQKIRTFYEMQCQLKREISLPGDDNIEVRSLTPGEEGRLTAVQNAAFTGSWGFKPNTIEEIFYQLSLKGSSINNVIGTFIEDELTAYCWTRKQNTVRIHMMGVSPYHRNMGLGDTVLKGGLKHLREAGCNQVNLTVDSKNEPALNLYKKNDFQISGRSYWFELRV